MIIGFLLPKIFPSLFLLVFTFKLNYKFIQSTIFIFIFYKILVKWLESFSKQVTTPKLKLSIIDFYFYFYFYNKFMFNATYQIIFYVRIFLYMIIGFLFFLKYCLQNKITFLVGFQIQTQLQINLFTQQFLIFFTNCFVKWLESFF